MSETRTLLVCPICRAVYAFTDQELMYDDRLCQAIRRNPDGDTWECGNWLAPLIPTSRVLPPEDQEPAR